MLRSLPFQVGPRTRRLLRYLGFAALALVTFVLALQLTFPYDRVRDKLVEALASKYEVTIASVERGLMPGRVYFKAVSLRTRPDSADEVPVPFFIEQLQVDLGLLALLGGTASIDLDAKIGPGRLAGNVSLSKRQTSVDLEGSGLPSAMLPMRALIGLPMSGKVGFAVALELPQSKGKTGRTEVNWQKAEGAIRFDCPSGCTFGDGKTKLKPKLKNARSQAFAADGVDFGKINVDSLAARVTIDDGKLEVTKFETKSQDGELHVDFSATLAPSFNESMVAGCLRFKGSEGLLQREPRTHAALSTTGANLGPDNLFHIRLSGSFANMKRLAQTCGPEVKSAAMDDFGGGAAARPNLTVQPADPSLTGGSATPPPPPPAPTPAPTPADAAPPATAPTPPGEPVPPGEAVAPEGEGPAAPAAPNDTGLATPERHAPVEPPPESP